MAETARDPDALQQEIDRTREELARTIDAIVERVSPKRAARRGVALMRENVTHAREAVVGSLRRDGKRRARPGALQEGAVQGGEPPEALRPGEEGGQQGEVSRPGAAALTAGEPEEEPLDVRTTTYRVRNTLRRDRVAVLAAGVALLVATGAVVAWRRSRG